MDGAEFKEMLSTHYDAAGNVYIEKVRKSNDPVRNRVFGNVKELGLIRPDYVEIKPGPTRAKDMFVVKVEGRIVKQLPRRDVIHIKTPNPANDFYGLSAISVIAWEADLDKHLTEFDVSFFRNAGVPMGLLMTKTRQTPDEIQQTKGAFRRAFQGVKKWFEVLVINADEAEYKPMGGMPKDMEMHDTRNFAESRICSVFGVPPIIVGVGVGLERATYANYEQAQQSFWSETMIPFTRTIASALTRELLPEFATTTDRGAFINFDTSNVKALQEDNSERLAIAGQLVGTGGWTVNEALASLRLPTMDTGDFYVRTIAQIVETPADQIMGRPMLTQPEMRWLNEPSTKAVKRTDRDRAIAKAQKDLESFFTAQMGRVIGRLPKGRKVIEDELLPSEEIAFLKSVLAPHQLQGIEIGFDFAAAQLGVDSEFSPTDPDVIRLLKEAAQTVTGITEETRSQIATIMAHGREAGWSVAQYADAIRQSGAFSASRAETIARTELGRADNLGAMERYERGGVERVEVLDGDFDTECATAHGQIWTLAEARANPLEHPRCVRSFAPVIGG
jgi:HK97 family phage portal protein